ncbi:MarR family winged helix-turn-helix transcriptional regulator [Actinokineospora spheciospongiae]|uniref:MarR family winged helix-turn-helix transcriptional regulator n=1 Tax=Actinokineospora spheciospongiae TaxID=909613 RepID=UPI001F1CE43A|nr:MarR family transcriptional regulator [Actinokineospora spheciospongiae]
MNPAERPARRCAAISAGVSTPGADNDVMERLQEVGVLTVVVEQRLGRALGINPTDLAAMDRLITEGPLTGRELADRLRISTAASTHVVDRLERAGHVRRRAHETDRRKVLVDPVEESVVRLLDHLRPLLDGVERLVGALSPADREVVSRFLGDVVAVYTSAADAMTADRPVSWIEGNS